MNYCASINSPLGKLGIVTHHCLAQIDFIAASITYQYLAKRLLRMKPDKRELLAHEKHR